MKFQTALCAVLLASLACGPIEIAPPDQPTPDAPVAPTAPCADVRCATGTRCEPATGACVVDECVAAGAVCGDVGGRSCGTCPDGATCATSRNACVRRVARLPFAEFTRSAVVAGDRLYSAGPARRDDEDSSLVELTLSTGETRVLASGESVTSPLASNGTHLFWTGDTGLRKLPIGGESSTIVTDRLRYCSSLLTTRTRAFCGYGGNARYGVDAFGIKSVALGGGAVEWPVSFLNYPQMSLVGNLLFYVGTTDNHYSFGNLGVLALDDGSTQQLVSGGALDSGFVLADDRAFYFVRRDGARATLVRASFEGGEGVDLLESEGFGRRTVVSTGDAIWSFSTVGGVAGLHHVATTGGAPGTLVTAADLGGVEHVDDLFESAGGWLLVSGLDVWAVFRP